MNRMNTKGKNAGILEKEETEVTSLDSEDFSVNALEIDSLKCPVSAVTGRKM